MSEINNHRISVEYLKNVLLKYLEAIAIGDEFQIKLLENVIFSILKVADIDKMKLEEKRNRSSFYFNLWHNAKAFLSARIYGVYGEEGNYNLENEVTGNAENYNKENENKVNDTNNVNVNVNVNANANAIHIPNDNNDNNNNEDAYDFDSNNTGVNNTNINDRNSKDVISNNNNNNYEYDDDDEIDVQF